jgi:hypothetical protein
MGKRPLPAARSASGVPAGVTEMPDAIDKGYLLENFRLFHLQGPARAARGAALPQL